LAGNDLSFGGPHRYGWQAGMTNHPDWLTDLGYTHPKWADLLKRMSPDERELVADYLRKLGIIP
jgi:hypothetical protein